MLSPPAHQAIITVLHSTVTWLPLTENWIYWQVKYLPHGIVSHIACEELENTSSFSLDNIHPLSGEPLRRRLLDKAGRRLGLRHHSRFLERTAHRTEAKVLHSHFGHVGWRDMGAVTGSHLKHVVSFYGADMSHIPHVDSRWPARYLELFAAADMILCQGDCMAARIMAMGCPNAIVRVHHLGVPVERIGFAQRLRHTAEPLRVLIAASFREKKGIPDAIHALQILHKHVPNLQITIVGDAGPDDRSQLEKRRIMDALVETGLRSLTRLLGFQPREELLEEALRHHIFLSPSCTASDGDTEGGAPVSLIEMSATGMPIVTTKHADIPAVVKDGESGLLAEEGDIEGLAECLLQLSEHPDTWGRMGVTGRLHVEREFNASTQGERLANLYRTLL